MIGLTDLLVSYINELRHVYLFLEEARDIVEAFERVACVTGVWKGKEGGLGARETRGARPPRVSLAPKTNSLSLPFQTPATQAIEMVITTNCGYWLKNGI